jgi:hypothetical protein
VVARPGGHNGGVPTKRYRLRLSPLRRASTTVVVALAMAFLLPGALASELPLWWRATSVVGLLCGVLGLRAIWGAVVVVRADRLRIQRTWPLRRDLRWYRILSIDVIPGFWHLELELNSGERLVLPPVRELQDLYESMERYRQALDV